MSKRYHCSECHSKFDKAREAAASVLGVPLAKVKRSELDEARFSFMPWDTKVLPMMKAGRGAFFPAHLTARGDWGGAQFARSIANRPTDRLTD